jgi:aminocarboxymuconate-semialdehyde decarboxylase
MIIDSHAHIVPAEFVEDVRREKFAPALSIEPGEKWESIVINSTASGQNRIFKNALPQETYDIALRLEHMAEMGVNKQILSIVPPLMGYGLDIGINMKIASAFNNHIAKLVSENPEQFSCLATIPLQDPAVAVEELERAVKTGHIGVQIGSNVAGKNLDDPTLSILWEKAESLDIPVFIHPINQLGGGDRLQNYQLGNLLGVPIECGIAAANLIFGGVLDRFPGVRIMLSHMGGIFPWVAGRMEHGYHERAGANVNQVKPPHSYMGRFFYDTIVHDADCLEFVAKKIGSKNILYGTDYPFDMGNLGAAREIPGLSRLDENDQEKILLDNAKQFFRL